MVGQIFIDANWIVIISKGFSSLVNLVLDGDVAASKHDVSILFAVLGRHSLDRFKVTLLDISNFKPYSEFEKKSNLRFHVYSDYE